MPLLRGTRVHAGDDVFYHRSHVRSSFAVDVDGVCCNGERELPAGQNEGHCDTDRSAVQREAHEFLAQPSCTPSRLSRHTLAPRLKSLFLLGKQFADSPFPPIDACILTSTRARLYSFACLLTRADSENGFPHSLPASWQQTSGSPAEISLV